MLGQTGCCDKRHKLALCKAKSGKGIILEKDKRGLKKGKGNYTFWYLSYKNQEKNWQNSMP